MKKILVTGGAGFLGSHLCKRLIKKNEVICVDNLFSGQKRNILDLLKNPMFEFIRHDVTFPLYLEVDEIYNLACPASPIHYQHDPIQTLKTAVHGSINVLGLAKRLNAKILQASTSEIYGDPKTHPQKEDYLGNVNPIGPRACYDEGKRAAETLFFDYKRMHKVRIKVARIFNTYGPCMDIDDGRVISNFIVQALQGKNITIFGDGMQTRSFCYVDDLIEGLIKLMNTNKKIETPVNLGNSQEYKIRDIAKIIIKLTNSKSKIKFYRLPQDDPKARQPDTSLAKKTLDWKANIKLEDGLKKTIAYFEDILASKK